MKEEKRVLTEEMLLEGAVDFKAPPVLSRRNREYFEKYARHLTMSDVKSLCEILQYPYEEIFTEAHLGAIIEYGFLELGGNRHFVGSSRIKDILLEIQDGRWEKNEVLHDISQLLSKHKPKERELKVRVYNYLLNEGFITLKEEKKMVEKTENRELDYGKCQSCDNGDQSMTFHYAMSVMGRFKEIL
ncbi:MAG: hypothetical protein ACOZBZ_01645 [Patescibacteria group bacterium]